MKRAQFSFILTHMYFPE